MVYFQFDPYVAIFEISLCKVVRLVFAFRLSCPDYMLRSEKLFEVLKKCSDEVVIVLKCGCRYRADVQLQPGLSGQ